MKPSTWNDKNQHWISRFLLKGFKAKGSSNVIFRLDCASGAIERRKIAKVASMYHLLTDRDDALMDSIENRACTVVDQLRKRKLRIGEEDRRALDRLVFALWANNPFHGVNKEKARLNVIERVVRDLVDTFASQSGVVDPAEITPWVNQLLNEDYLSHTMDTPPHTIDTPLGTVERVLRQMTLNVCHPPNGEFFVIGDAPVSMVREKVNGSTNLRNLGSQVIFPIGSGCLLLYDWSPGHQLVQAGPVLSSRDLVSLDDDYRYKLRYRYIYGRDEATLERTSRLRLQWRSKQTPRFGSSGWVTAQLEYQAADLALEVEEKESNRRLRNIARDIVSTARLSNLSAPTELRLTHSIAVKEQSESAAMPNPESTEGIRRWR